MIDILNLLVSLLLSVTSPAPARATTATASTPYNCYCQTMPGKDWGK